MLDFWVIRPAKHRQQLVQHCPDRIAFVSKSEEVHFVISLLAAINSLSHKNKDMKRRTYKHVWVIALPGFSKELAAKENKMHLCYWGTPFSGVALKASSKSSTCEGHP